MVHGPEGDGDGYSLPRRRWPGRSIMLRSSVVIDRSAGRRLQVPARPLRRGGPCRAAGPITAAGVVVRARPQLLSRKLVLRRRKQLLEDGRDHGPQSIQWSLQRDETPNVPSRSTIWRILTRHGLITPQPQKRPKSATKRFTFSRPNECWQSDWTGWALADGTSVAIAGSLDDHSRYLAGLQADPGDASSALVWSVILAGITECGVPAMSLTDNGFVYTGKWRGFECSFEANLRALGTTTINSRPFHPQTCGKIERFWQTLKKWLCPRPTPATLAELNDLLDQFRAFYNHQRPHRACAEATPAQTFAATDKAPPGRSATARTGLRQPPHRRRLTSGNLQRRALPHRRRTALGRLHLRRHPPRPTHRDLQQHHPHTRTDRRSRPLSPTLCTQYTELTAPANPNRHHDCQRCPET